MRKPYLIVVLVVGIFLTLIFAVLSFLTTRQLRVPDTSAPPVPSADTTPTPSDTVTLSGVRINNPELFPLRLTPQGDTLMTEEARYSLVYLKDFEQFIITINQSPFEEFRGIAENALLEKLGISQLEACSLDVSIGTPEYVNPDEAGINHKLSFCE